MQSMKRSHFLAPVMCALLVPTFTFAQNSASFNIVTSNAEPDNPGNIYAFDVNNDGLTDLVEDNGYSPGSYFYVSINKGNGKFAAPVQYAIPGSAGGPMCIAAADFNNDGKIDLAVPMVNTNQIAVYLGNGNGTFQSPTLSTVNFPNGTGSFDVAGCAAADFNANGDIDLAASINGELYVFQGKGNGRFDASGYFVLGGAGQGAQIFVGDYNGDGKADIAMAVPSGSGTPINVLYGNNNFTFTDTTPYTYSGYLMIGSGDLNSDGITDVYALTNYNGAQQFGVLYGTTSKTFNSYWIDIPATDHAGSGPAAQPWISQLTMGDYNGDGRMDLAAASVNTANNEQDVIFFLAGANPGEFTTQTVTLPTTPPYITSPVAGLLSGGYLKPDVTTNLGNGGSNDTTPTTLPALLNTTQGNFGFCPYPHSGKGFHVCAPGVSKGNNASFSAAADSFGKLRTISLWVDGKQVQKQSHTWDTHAYFDWVGTFSSGAHEATFYASDVDNTTQRYDFNFTVGSAQ